MPRRDDDDDATAGHGGASSARRSLLDVGGLCLLQRERARQEGVL
jgi:hypothetical protein